MPCGGWRSGTAMTTSTSSRCWPGRMAAVPALHNDRYRVREACLAAEQRYGLRRTAPGDRTAACRPTRAESEKAARRGLEEAPRITLRRQVSTAAAAAASEQEFFARLRQSGVLVRTRSSTRNPGQFTGYAVALPGDTSHGRVAGLVRRRETRRRPDPAQAAPPLGRSGQLRGMTRSPRPNAARSGTMPLASPMTRPFRSGCSPRLIRPWPRTRPGPQPAPCTWPPRRWAAGFSARPPTRTTAQPGHAYGRIPAPTPAGNSLRRAARLLAAYGYITSDPSFRPIVLITRLAALAEAVAVLRQAQEHAAQAASALRAAERLHAAGRAYAAHAPKAISARPGLPPRSQMPDSR